MLKNILLITLFLVGCEKKKANFVIVGEGETLEIICEKYNISKKHLISINNLKPPYVLCSGQILKYKKIETKSKILLVKNEENSTLQEEKIDLFSIEGLKTDPQTDASGILELDSGLQEELAKEEQVDKQSIECRKKEQKEQKAKLEKIEYIKKEEKKLETVKIVKLDILFPIANGKIDNSMPFSQKHGKRQDGVFILNAGNVLAPCDGQIVFVDHANKSVYVKRNINNLSWIITYSNLSSIAISQGDFIKRGDKLAESSGSIFMRIWNGKEYINPSIMLNS